MRFRSANTRRASFLLLAGLVIVASTGCHDKDGTGPAPAGTVAGTVTSSLGGPLAGIQVTAAPANGDAPDAVTTGADGKFSISGVLVGDGTGSISLAALPANCTNPGDVGYSGLAKGSTVAKDIEVECRALVGTITGTVTSTLGGPLADVQVTVDPEGDAPPLEGTTDSEGLYSIEGIAAGAGSVTVTGGLPVNCSAPSAAPYEELGDGDSKTVDITVPCEAAAGALAVNLVGVADFTPSVRVTGPGGLDTTIAASSILTDLAPGNYTVSASPIVVDDPIVVSEYVAIVTGSPAAVDVGDTTTVNVAYAVPSGSGSLWVSTLGPNGVIGFSASQLQASGSPLDTIGFAGPSYVKAAALDRDGNIWLASMLGQKLSAYDRGQRVGGGTPTPIRTLEGGLVAPLGLAFDDDGNLWVANAYSNNLLEYSAAQVASGGSVTPITTITSPDLSTTASLAFDAAGNLWVANSGNNSITQFSKAQLATGGDFPAAVKIATPGAFSGPSGLAFDPTGRLWVSNNEWSPGNHLLIAFTPSQLAAGGSPEPSVFIDRGSTISVGGIAFDASGGLWVAAGADNALLRYSPSQLSAGGTQTPDRVITAAPDGGLMAPAVLIFDPHPVGLPIR